MDVIVNQPAIDYIRATTFDAWRYMKMVEDLDDNCDREWERGGFMQYKGNKSGGLFHGQGEQSGRTHYMVQASGSQSDDYGYRILASKPNITRLDLQITLEKPDFWNVREFTDQLRAGEWPNRRRKITAVDGNGEDTVYIGSRTSEKFVRVYVKHKNWLRFEIEIKGDAARLAAGMVANDGKRAIAAIMRSEIQKMPDSPILAMFLGELGEDGSGELRVTRVSPSKINRMKWLASLLPTIEEMVNDHDYGSTVQSWLGSLLEGVKDNER